MATPRFYGMNPGLLVDWYERKVPAVQAAEDYRFDIAAVEHEPWFQRITTGCPNADDCIEVWRAKSFLVATGNTAISALTRDIESLETQPKDRQAAIDQLIENANVRPPKNMPLPVATGGGFQVNIVFSSETAEKLRARRGAFFPPAAEVSDVPLVVPHTEPLALAPRLATINDELLLGVDP